MTARRKNASETTREAARGTPRLRVTSAILLPLALAQFMNSYGTSAMNVAISDVTHDLHTSITSVQASISLYTLVMAAGMILGSKFADIFGRRRAFNAGVILYGVGGLIAAVAPTISVMTTGYSIIQGIGSDLMIPALYILATVNYKDLKARAAAFGIISGMAGVGGATGPLIGGVITTTLSWRWSFLLQVPVAIFILFLRSRVVDAEPPKSKPKLDLIGAIVSGTGMTLLVLGALLANQFGWVVAKKDLSIGGVTLPEGGISPVVIFFALGVILLLAFGWLCDRRERHGKEPLVPTRILFDRVAAAGLIVQSAQWFLQLGVLFLVTVFVQQALGLNAVQSGLVMLPAIIGLLVLSRRASPLAERFSLRFIMQVGFVVAEIGILLLVLLADQHGSAWRFAPGLLLLGSGMGLIMPASVTFVQSTSPEQDQAAISGVSRSASNLGSSLGTAVAGSIMVVAVAGGANYQRALAFSLIGVAGASLIGFIATFFIPERRATSPAKGVPHGAQRATGA